MTAAEKQEIREIIQDCTAVLNVKMELSVKQQKEFQEAVLQRMDKFNGRVYNLEKTSGERGAIIQEFHDFKREVYPKLDRMENTEKQVLENSVSKKTVAKIIGFSFAGSTALWAIIQALEKFFQ